MIIIETPQPPLREAITITGLRKTTVRPAYSVEPVEKEVLDPSTTRDATPEDLERAGWAPLSAFVGPLDLLSPPTLEGALEAIRDFLRERNEELEAHLLSEQRLDRALDEARSERAEADGLLVQRETELRLAREAHDAAKASEVVWAGRARKAEAERDEAREALAKWQGSAEQERARIVADLRHDAAHLAWPIGTAPNEVLRVAADRIERGEHAGTPVPAAEPSLADHYATLRAAARRMLTIDLADAGPQAYEDMAKLRRALEATPTVPLVPGTPVLPRATDEELADAYNEAFHAHAGDVSASRLAAVRAVAARVRREQCLVTRAVEAGLDVAIVEAHADAERPGLRYIVRITEAGGEETEETVPAADVPATLERLLEEVTR